MRSLAPLVLLALAGCRSTAPATVGAAAINTGVGLLSAATQRAVGGCYAVCTHGTACDPKSGMCVKADHAPGSNEVCRVGPGGEMQCIPFEITAERPAGAASGSGVGISPATGSVPPPPSEASPRGP